MDTYGTLTSSDTVTIERLLPGPIERIWEFLTDSRKRGLWLASGDMEQRAGGRFELKFRNSSLGKPDEPAPQKYAHVADEAGFSGRVLECDPPTLLAYVWGDDSQVRFELATEGDEVRLRIVHSRLPDRDQAISVASGWHAHLDILREVMDGRAPGGFWARHTRLEAEYSEHFGADRTGPRQ